MRACVCMRACVQVCVCVCHNEKKVPNEYQANTTSYNYKKKSYTSNYRCFKYYEVTRFHLVPILVLLT